MAARSEEALHPGGLSEAALFDYQAGRLHGLARDWAQAHLETCSECAHSLAWIREVFASMEPPEIDPHQRQAILWKLRGAPEPARRGRSPGVAIAWGAAALGAVLLCARFLPRSSAVRTPHREAAPALAMESPPLQAAVFGVEGQVSVRTSGSVQPISQGAQLAEGAEVTGGPRARLELRWGHAVLSAQGGAGGLRLKLVASRAQDRTVGLEAGRVLLDVSPLAPGAKLEVLSGDERVSVHGTRFSVERDASGTVVAVDRGLVRVRRRRSEVEVHPGQKLAPQADLPGPLSAEERAAFEGLLSEEQLDRRHARVMGLLEVASIPEDAEVIVDGEHRGTAPVLLELPVGPHSVHVQKRHWTAKDESVQLTDSAPTLVEARLKPLGPTPHPASDDGLAPERALLLRGSYEQAIARLEQVRRRAPAPRTQRRAVLLEAQALRLSHRAEEALDILEPLTAHRSVEGQQAQYLYAQMLQLDLKSSARAADAWRASRQHFPRGMFYEDAWFREGESRLAAGELDEGSQLLRSYVERYPRGVHLADAQRLLKEVSPPK